MPVSTTTLVQPAVDTAEQLKERVDRLKLSAQAQAPVQPSVKDETNGSSSSASASAGASKGKEDAKSVKIVDPFNYVGETFGTDYDSYPYADFLPHNPTRTESDPPLAYFDISDRGHRADPNCARLRAFVEARGGRVRDLGIAIGTVIEGDAKIEELGEEERDDLALLIAQRGVVFWRKQRTFSIEEHRKLGSHFGPLHKHATYAVPRRPDLDDVVVVYTDKYARPDPYSFSRADLFHSDVTYEIQPPGATILKLYTTPEVGNDTLWSSGYALYSSLSKPYQKYLESLYALHSGFNQAASRSGTVKTPRREPIETAHPIVRVHPVTGWKAVFVNPGFVTRIIGVPKAESDATLEFLKQSFAQQTDSTVRWRWETDDVAMWDNRMVNHSATFDAYPSLRHGLRVTPHAEKPLSVEDYEKEYKKPAKDWIEERYKSLGIEPPAVDDGKTNSKGYRD